MTVDWPSVIVLALPSVITVTGSSERSLGI